ncbi:uncharacterized protein A4U43_C07F28930 [Asparagus officinalis]|uniref:Ninja-family protein n=1 Tax=Asparagus officinalis TaxID=4686 RepID=A0A5P1EFM6_ASPOF|nr:uncharacterized protein A4U43_C07F28930 [Asparagus officinalis]
MQMPPLLLWLPAVPVAPLLLDSSSYAESRGVGCPHRQRAVTGLMRAKLRGRESSVCTSAERGSPAARAKSLPATAHTWTTCPEAGGPRSTKPNCLASPLPMRTRHDVHLSLDRGMLCVSTGTSGSGSKNCVDLQTSIKPANPSAGGEENPSKKRSCTVNDGVKEMERSMMEEMPCVSTKGDGPNGRRVEGFLYRYRKGEEVRIVCVCHGTFLTPAEFVKHAGGGDVVHPLRHIVVNPAPSAFL